MTRSTFVAATVLAMSFMAAHSGAAQEPGLKLAVGDFGLGIGDVPRLDGLRLNFRDRHLERVRGINATIWSPHEDADGTVRGIALGFPLTGAGRLSGLALGAGIAVSEEFRGVGFAPLGMGAGGRMTGIMVAGLGIGGGGDLEGIMSAGWEQVWVARSAARSSPGSEQASVRTSVGWPSAVSASPSAGT